MTKVNNMFSTNISGGVFTTIGGNYDAGLWFVVPLYRGLIKKMGNPSLISPSSQVRHEVSIKETDDQKYFSHRRRKWVRKVFRLYIIQVKPIPFNSLKLLVVRCFCIQLDRGWGVFIEAAIYMLNLGEVALSGGRGLSRENNGSINYIYMA